MLNSASFDGGIGIDCIVIVLDVDLPLKSDVEKVETGKYKIRVAPDDTKTIETGNYYYDLQIGVNDDIFTDIIYNIFFAIS